jgi:hypothetical protein
MVREHVSQRWWNTLVKTMVGLGGMASAIAAQDSGLHDLGPFSVSDPHSLDGLNLAARRFRVAR